MTVGLPGLWPVRKQRRRRIAALVPYRDSGRSRTGSCLLDGLKLAMEDEAAEMVSSAGLCIGRLPSELNAAETRDEHNTAVKLATPVDPS